MLLVMGLQPVILVELIDEPQAYLSQMFMNKRTDRMPRGIKWLTRPSLRCVSVNLLLFDNCSYCFVWSTYPCLRKHVK